MTTAEIAQAVAEALQGTYPDWQIVRTYLPEAEAETIQKRLTVVPRGTAFQTLARGTTRVVHRVDVALQDRLDSPTEPTAFDALVAETHAMALFLDGLRPAGCYAAEIEIEPLYSLEHVRSAHVFTAVIQTTYHEPV